MRKTLLVLTTMALALLLAAGTAWAALPSEGKLCTTRFVGRGIFGYSLPHSREIKG